MARLYRGVSCAALMRRSVLFPGLCAAFLGVIAVPGPAVAEQRDDPGLATGQTRKPIAFTEFARATAINIEDIRSDLSAHEPAMSGSLAQAVFCSIHQVYEVRPAGPPLGMGKPSGILEQLKAAKP